MEKQKHTTMTGIYIEYHDTLHCDAYRVWVYRNGNNLLDASVFKKLTDNEYRQADMEKEVSCFGGIRVAMVGDSDYYGTRGIITTVKILHEEFPDLKVKCFKQGWHTFPQKWMDVENHFKSIFPEAEMLPGNKWMKENNIVK